MTTLSYIYLIFSLFWYYITILVVNALSKLNLKQELDVSYSNKQIINYTMNFQKKWIF